MIDGWLEEVSDGRLIGRNGCGGRIFVAEKLCFFRQVSQIFLSEVAGMGSRHRAHVCSLVSAVFVWNLK